MKKRIEEYNAKRELEKKKEEKVIEKPVILFEPEVKHHPSKDKHLLVDKLEKDDSFRPLF
jgi:hypothetical protein